MNKVHIVMVVIDDDVSFPSLFPSSSFPRDLVLVRSIQFPVWFDSVPPRLSSDCSSPVDSVPVHFDSVPPRQSGECPDLADSVLRMI